MSIRVTSKELGLKQDCGEKTPKSLQQSFHFERSPLASVNNIPDRHKKSKRKPESDMPTSEVTERAMKGHIEPEDYLVSLQGPMYTLFASLRENSAVTVLDVAEAYAIITGRIRKISKSLKDESPILFSPSDVDILQKVLQRDIDRCRESPFPRHQIKDTEPQQQRPNTAQLKASRDVAVTANYALVLLSDFFRLPFLRDILSPSQSSMLLKSVLDLGLKEDLQSYNDKKTYRAIVCILRTQILPYSVLRSLSTSIAKILLKAVQGKLGSETNDGAVFDGLRAIAHFSRRFPRQSIRIFATFAPAILCNLFSDVEETRFATCDCLCAFADAVANSKVGVRTCELLSMHIDALFKEYLQDTNKDKTLSFTKLLPRSGIDPKGNRSYALIPLALCACIVITGPRFPNLQSLTTAVVKTFKDLVNSRRPAIAMLLSCIQRCFLFALAQVDFLPEKDQQILEEKCFKTFSTATSESVQCALIAFCLVKNDGQKSQKQNLRALSIVKAMIKVRSSRSIATKILHGITRLSPESGRSQWNNTHLIPQALFGRDSLTELSGEALREAIEQIPKFSVTHLRCLIEEELTTHWQVIVSMWRDLVLHSLNEVSHKSDLNPELLDIWQSLLLNRGLSTQESRDPAVSKSLKSHIGSTLQTIVELPLKNDDIDENVKQMKILTTVQSLWKVLDRCFSGRYLHDIASQVLSVLQTRTFNTSDHKIKRVHSSLVVALTGTLDPPFSPLTSEPTSMEFRNASRQHLFTLEAEKFLKDKGRRSITELIKIIYIPQQCDLEKPALDIWKSLFDIALEESEEKLNFLRHLFDRFHERDDTKLSSSTLVLIEYILDSTFIVLDRHGSSLHFGQLGSFLGNLYAPNPAILPLALKLFSVLRKFAPTIVDLGKRQSLRFNDLQNGLIPWLQDTYCAIPGEAYNEYIVPFYSDILESLREVGVTDGLVVQFADILVAPMDRDPLPPGALGPELLKKFWDDVHPSLTLSESTCPERLVNHVKVLIYFLGGELPTWMESESPNEHHAIRSILAKDENVPQEIDLADSAQQRAPSVRSFEEISAGNSSNPDGENYLRKRRKILSIKIPPYPDDDEHLCNPHDCNLHESADDEMELESSKDVSDPNVVYPPSSFSLGGMDNTVSGKVAEPASARTAPDDVMSDEDEVVPESLASIHVDDEEEMHSVHHSSDQEVIIDEAIVDCNLSASHRIERTQTAPSILPSNFGNLSLSPQGPTVLRRAQTTPVPAHEALIKLGEDIEFMETQELASAARRTTELLGKITAKMTTKLARSKGETPDCDG